MILAHDDIGDGPPVVLIHSGVCDRRMWAHQVEALRGAHRVVAPDLRGFGDSALPVERFGHADDVVALLDHCGIERAMVVGASFGGKVSIELAVTHPERVSALVLLCAAFRGIADTADSEAFDEEEGRLLEAGDVDGAVELNLATWLGPAAADDARKLVREMQRHAFDVQLAADELDPGPTLVRVDADPAQVRAPTLVVGGELDMDCSATARETWPG